MQKTQQDLSVDYRLVFDGRTYKIQELDHEFDNSSKSGWKDHLIAPWYSDKSFPFETRWRWGAHWKLARLRKREAARRRANQAVWEVVG